VAGNDIAATANHDLIDIAAHPDIAPLAHANMRCPLPGRRVYTPRRGQRVAIGNRNRVIIGLITHQCLRVHLAAGLITGIKRCRWQVHHPLPAGA